MQRTAALISQSVVSAIALRSLFLFEALPNDQLLTLAANSVLVDHGIGVIFREGEAARYFYVLVDGELILSKRAGSRDVETGRTTHRGTYCGATAAFIRNPPHGYTFTVRTAQPSRFVRIDADLFGQFVRTNYPMAVHLLQGVIVDHEGVHQIIDEQHRIQAVGTLTAGLMHGLNNPAAAITRIADELRTRHRDDSIARTRAALTPTAAAVFDRLRCEARNAVEHPVNATPLIQAEREDAVGDWLDHHGVDRSWILAPALATAGLGVAWLDHTAAVLRDVGAYGQLSPTICAVSGEIETAMLVDELAKASVAVSTLVASARQYSQLDSTPLTVANVHDLLDSTLIMMSAVIDDAISVRRDYAHGLPELTCYASELNQAWTNIIDNAIAAIQATEGGRGEITVHTALADTGVVRVQICDTGIGIPADIRDRIFLPFFTTKPVGMGVGMGLDLAWRTIVGRHHGSLGVASVPGDTRITACLPVHNVEPARARG